MEELKLTKTEYKIPLYKNVIDTNFNELTLTNQPTSPDLDTVENFFRLYQLLFYDIPKDGDSNSHKYIITESTNYVGMMEQNNQDVQALLDEIAQLRQELLDRDKTILNISSQISKPQIDITSELVSQVQTQAQSQIGNLGKKIKV